MIMSNRIMVRNQKLPSADQLGKENKGQSHRLMKPKSMSNIVYTIISHNALTNSQHNSDLLHTIEKLLANIAQFTLVRANLLCNYL